MSNITRLSRYYTGPLAQIPDKYTGDYNIAVFRQFDDQGKVSYFDYTWVVGDTLSLIANKYLGNPILWWRILEINPEITDPFSIIPGQTIRVPYVSR